MAIEFVEFMAMDEARKLAPREDVGFVSITDPSFSCPISNGWGSVLHLTFVDSEYDETVIRIFGNDFERIYTDYFNKGLANQLVTFISRVAGNREQTGILVHCHHGQGRSAAVAMYVANRFSLKLHGDLSRHNKLVLQLLNNPCYYDDILKQYTTDTSTPASKANSFTKLMSLFGVK